MTHENKYTELEFGIGLDLVCCTFLRRRGIQFCNLVAEII